MSNPKVSGLDWKSSNIDHKTKCCVLQKKSMNGGSNIPPKGPVVVGGQNNVEG